MASGAAADEFSTRQSQIAFLASLSEPVFSLVPTTGGTYAAIYNHLSKYGATLGDIRPESTGPALSDAAVSCTLRARGAVVRFRLDSVEVWGDNTTSADFPAIATDAVAAVLEAVPTVRVTSQSVVLILHVEVSEQLRSAWLGQLAAPPWAATSLKPIGVSFSSPLSDQGEATVVLERSAIFPGAVFARMTCSYPGELVPVEACRKGSEFFAATLTTLRSAHQARVSA